jgi:hypothetical protein
MTSHACPLFVDRDAVLGEQAKYYHRGDRLADAGHSHGLGRRLVGDGCVGLDPGLPDAILAVEAARLPDRVRVPYGLAVERVADVLLERFDVERAGRRDEIADRLWRFPETLLQMFIGRVDLRRPHQRVQRAGRSEPIK